MELYSPVSESQEESDEDKLVHSISKLSPEARQRALKRDGALDLNKYHGASIRVYD